MIMPTELEIVRVNPEETKSPISRLSSLEDLWHVFVRMRGDVMPATIADYAYIGKKFCGFMSGKPLEPQSMVDWVIYIQDYRKSYRSQGKLTANFINRINTRIRSFLRWLKTMGYIHKDLDECIPHLPEPALKESRVITEQEFEAVKAYCTGREHAQTLMWLVILGYRTGMSLVDCCHLRWRHVHLDNNGPSFIDIHRIKTKRLGGKSLCQIPIIPFTDVHNWLIQLKEREHLNYKRFDGITDYVHQDAPGLYACAFARIARDFKYIFRKSGVEPGKSFKHLRNAFCSMLVNSNTNIALVCKMTGHNNVKTLLRYLKADRRALQDGLARAFCIASEKAGTGSGNSGFDE